MKVFLMKRALRILNLPVFDAILTELRTDTEAVVLERFAGVLERLRKTPTLEMGKTEAFDLGVTIGFLACSMRDENGGEK